MRTHVVLSVVLMAGCAAPCELGSGSYDVTINWVSGDCGDIPSPTEPVVLFAGDLPIYASDCSGRTPDISDDRCVITYNQMCPSVAGISENFTGQTTVVDEFTAVGTFTARQIDDAALTVLCEGRYNISWEQR